MVICHQIVNEFGFHIRFQVSLQETEEVNKDEETLFEDTLFEFDTSLVPMVSFVFHFIFIRCREVTE